MRERNIALIGFRATGKSTVGKILARELNRLFVDMDTYLAASSGREIACWVRLEGWSSFRKAESELLQKLSERQGLVVATGGGVVLSPQNREILADRFQTVWLKASEETISRRIGSDPQSCSTRPPLSDLTPEEEIRTLLLERELLYEEAADIVIGTEGKSPEDVAGEVLSRIKPNACY